MIGKTPVVRGYFNNHYGAKAIANSLNFGNYLEKLYPIMI